MTPKYFYSYQLRYLDLICKNLQTAYCGKCIGKQIFKKINVAEVADIIFKKKIIEKKKQSNEFLGVTLSNGNCCITMEPFNCSCFADDIGIAKILGYRISRNVIMTIYFENN